MNNQEMTDVPDIFRYDEVLFVYINDDNYEEAIHEFCRDIYLNNIRELDDKEYLDSLNPDNKKLITNDATLEEILKRLPRPFTIIQENHHIDKSFRDSYYTYYSNQHFQTKRYSRRLSFFQNIVDEDLFFFFFSENVPKEVHHAFMGTCVVNPLSKGMIGRTLINPKYLISKNSLPVYVRLSKYTLHIYGKKLTVKAFPYRMQDSETMSCVEVTLLNLTDYYSNSYKDYPSVVPSDILKSIQKQSHERVLPSKGATYPILTKALSDFGFSPRLYNLNSIDSYSLSYLSKKDKLKRWLHYYIESGIPVAVNLMPKGQKGPGHSVICIGHGKENGSLRKKAFQNKYLSYKHRDTAHPLINSADFYDEYVIIDDNEPVYQVRTFDKLATFSDLEAVNLAVPLYKRMFMDAPDANTIVRAVLQHKELGITAWCDGFLEPKEDVIIRLFMASSSGLKSFRIASQANHFIAKNYALIPMPRFVWVCELYRVSDYEELKAFGEIVLDATSVPGNGQETDSLILARYPKKIAYRMPEDAEIVFDENVEVLEDDLFPGYRHNLEKYGL